MPTNSKHLIHKKSNALVGNAAKLPTSDDIRHGEIAINYKKGYETISTLNDQNEIVEFASKNFVSANYASLAQLDAQIAQAIAAAVAATPPSSGQQALIDAIMESVTKVINNAVNAQSPTTDQQALLAAISASVAKAIEKALAPGSASTEIINQINAAIEAFMANSDKFTGSGTVTVSHDTTNKKITINSPKPDWNATAGAGNEILNKPSIPTVNDATFKVYSKVDNTTTEVGGTSANASNNTSVTLVQGSNVTLTTDATNKEITISATDTNTTYTFANGTNGFTVTPLGGEAQSVTVTPSIANNVTGNAEWTSENVITVTNANSGNAIKQSGKTITTTNPSGNSDDTTIPTSKAVWGAIADGIATTDAMVYKTTINGGNEGDYGALTPAADKGYTYKVALSGKIDGVEVKVGDLLLCNTDNTPAATASDYSTIKNNWDFVHTTLDGTLFKDNNSFTDGHVLLADGTAGKVKDSGCTIETSVPSNAVFTDTTYTFAGGTNKITVTPSVGSAQDVTITPSITNNVTYTGSVTSGRVATFNSAGVVQDSGFTIGKSVPSDAVFTDTTYEFEGTYNASTNKAATESTVTDAIGNLGDAAQKDVDTSISSGSTSTNLPTTAAVVGYAGTAVSNSHTHSNKSVLDGISSTDITNWNSKGNGDVTGPSSSVNNRVATFNGTTGKAIQDSGFTIGKTVPSDAVFTDANVTQTISTTNNADYRILLSSSANNTTTTEGARKSSNLYYNPSTKALTTGGAVNGLTLTSATTGFKIAGGTTSKTLTVGDTYTLGAACAKGVTDNSSATAVTSSDTNLITGRTLYYAGYTKLVLGNTSSTAYRGDYGETAYNEATYLTGVTTATTVASVAVTARNVIVTIANGQTSQSFSLESTPADGREIHIIVDNSANGSKLTVGIPHGTENGITYVNVNDMNNKGVMEIAANKIGEINVIYAGPENAKKAYIRYIGA